MQKIIHIAKNHYCIVDNECEWSEGPAYLTDDKKFIYYNGDYGESRPSNVVKLVAEPYQIGWVRHMMDDTPFVSKFDDAIKYVKECILNHNGQCIVEDKKIEGKFVIKLTL